MKKEVKAWAVVFALVMAGCARESNEAKRIRGEARISLFKECMTLAAMNPRKGDDDVSDIVSACSSHAGYMTNFITDIPTKK